MDSETAKENLLRAVRLLKLELGSVGRAVGERATMFRLAYYMPAWSEVGCLRVDCEYNRHKDDVKAFHDFPCKKEDAGNGNRKSQRFFPDIVLHQRGTDRNILVCDTNRLDR